MKSMMTTTTTKLGVFVFGLLLAMTGGLAVLGSQGVTLGAVLAGAVTLVGVLTMIKSFSLTADHKPSRLAR